MSLCREPAQIGAHGWLAVGCTMLRFWRRLERHMFQFKAVLKLSGLRAQAPHLDGATNMGTPKRGKKRQKRQKWKKW